MSIQDKIKAQISLLHFSAASQISGVFAMTLVVDLLNPSLASEKRKHKKKRLVQSPNSFFTDVKCNQCQFITTIFTHAHTVVSCPSCEKILSKPTGGKAKITEGCSFRRKAN